MKRSYVEAKAITAIVLTFVNEYAGTVGTYEETKVYRSAATAATAYADWSALRWSRKNKTQYRSSTFRDRRTKIRAKVLPIFERMFNRMEKP